MLYVLLPADVLVLKLNDYPHEPGMLDLRMAWHNRIAVLSWGFSKRRGNKS